MQLILYISEALQQILCRNQSGFPMQSVNFASLKYKEKALRLIFYLIINVIFNILNLATAIKMKCPYPLLCKLFLIYIYIFIFSLFLLFCILLFIPRRYFVTFQNRLDYQELKIARVKEIHGKINYCYAFY